MERELKQLDFRCSTLFPVNKFSISYTGQMSESWLHENSPNAVIAVPGFNIFRNDRGHGGDGGVLCCVEDSISCNEILFTDSDLECLGLSVVLFPEMSFTPASITSSLWGKSVISFICI